MPLLWPTKSYENEDFTPQPVDPGLGAYLGSRASEYWERMLFSSASRVMEQHLSNYDSVTSAYLAILAGDDDVSNVRDKISAEDATERYGIAGQLTFEEDVSEAEAKLLRTRKIAEIERLKTGEAGSTGPLRSVAGFGLGFAMQFLDPINVGTMFIPVVSNARYARMVQKLGGPGRARFAKGVIESTVGNAMVEPLVLLAASNEQANYNYVDSMANFGFGALAGGVLHSGAGAIGDAISAKQLKGSFAQVAEQIAAMSDEEVTLMMRSAMADLAVDKPVSGPQKVASLSPSEIEKELLASAAELRKQALRSLGYSVDAPRTYELYGPDGEARGLHDPNPAEPWFYMLPEGDGTLRITKDGDPMLFTRQPESETSQGLDVFVANLVMKKPATDADVQRVAASLGIAPDQAFKDRVDIADALRAEGFDSIYGLDESGNPVAVIFSGSQVKVPKAKPIVAERKKVIKSWLQVAINKELRDELSISEAQRYMAGFTPVKKDRHPYPKEGILRANGYDTALEIIASKLIGRIKNVHIGTGVQSVAVIGENLVYKISRVDPNRQVVSKRSVPTPRTDDEIAPNVTVDSWKNDVEGLTTKSLYYRQIDDVWLEISERVTPAKDVLNESTRAITARLSAEDADDFEFELRKLPVDLMDRHEDALAAVMDTKASRLGYNFTDLHADNFGINSAGELVVLDKGFSDLPHRSSASFADELPTIIEGDRLFPVSHEPLDVRVKKIQEARIKEFIAAEKKLEKKRLAEKKKMESEPPARGEDPHDFPNKELDEAAAQIDKDIAELQRDLADDDGNLSAEHIRVLEELEQPIKDVPKQNKGILAAIDCIIKKVI